MVNLGRRARFFNDKFGTTGVSEVGRHFEVAEGGFLSELFSLGRKRPNLKFFLKKITFKRPTPSGDDGDPLASTEEP